MRVPREWVWVVILVAVLAIALLGCGGLTDEQRAEERRAEREEYYTRNFHEIEYEGHLYVVFSRNDRMGLTHAAHCKARHR